MQAILDVDSLKEHGVTLPTTKPPPQIAGVQGIDAIPVTMYEPPNNTFVDWIKVVSLPPFQMFAAERMRNTSGKDAQEHAADYVRAHGAGADVFQSYCQWHQSKGYWKNETPMGELRP